MRKKKHYKIVQVFGDTLWSYTGRAPFGNTEYSPNKDSFREEGCGPLAVFKSLEDCKAFLRIDWGGKLQHQVWECEIDESFDDCLWIKDSYGFFGSPDGTVFADVVRLTKFVSDVTKDFVSS